MIEKNLRLFAVILSLALIALIIANVNIYNRIANLENTIVQTEFNHSQELQNMRFDISDSINEQIAQAMRASYDESTRVLSFDGQSASADIEISFRLKEYGAEDAVSVTASGSGGHIINTVSQYELGLFKAQMTLPVEDNYSLNFNSRGLSIRSGELMNINIANMLCERFDYGLGIGFTGGSSARVNYMSFHPSIGNSTNGDDALKISSILFSVESGGVEVASWDLMPFLRTDGVFQRIDTYADIDIYVDVDADMDVYADVGVGVGVDADMDINADVDVDMYVDGIHDRFQLHIGNGSGQLTPDAPAVTRLVIYDNIGIRYEQMNMYTVPGSFNDSTGAGFGSATAFTNDSFNRVINYGDDSWDFIHIVRQR